MAQNKRPSRRQKINSETSTGRVVKEKFKEMYQPPPLKALTDKQQVYLDMLRDPKIQLLICTGHFGCGKSYLSASVAADKFKSNEISKIVVARPYVQTGSTSGYKPGSSLMKLYPYVRNVLDPIRKRLGSAAFDIALADGERGDIEVQELESIRGRSFDDPSWLMLEESQQSTPEEMLAVVTRVGDNCKLIVSGDLNQTDVKGDSGLRWLLEFAKRHNMKRVGIVNFDSPSDIVRGGLVRDIALGLLREGKLGANS